MRINEAKAKLRAGESLRMCAVGVPCLTIVEIIGHSGIECVALDTEHSAIGVNAMDSLLFASRAVGVVPFWRFGKFDDAEMRRALDIGYQCFIVPHIRNAAEAERIIRSTRYAPRGHRGVGPGRPIRFGMDDPLEYTQRADQEILVTLMIEEREAVENIDQILAVDGVELVHLGLWDLSMTFGLPFQVRHPKIVEAAERVLRAAQARGVWVGIPPTSPEDMQEWEARGMRFFEVASAEGLLAEAARKCAEHYASCREQPSYEAS